jgi:hypothetical protein
MILATIPAQPFEAFPLWIDFAPRMVPGDTFQAADATVTARIYGTSTDATSDVLTGDITVEAGTKALRLKKTGSPAGTYLVEFRVTTAAGHKLEDELKLVVAEA